MTIIYACESWEYSDYRVDALFSHREDAEFYAKVNGCDVVERQLDPDVMTQYRAGLHWYCVVMNRDGRVRYVEAETSDEQHCDQGPRAERGSPGDEWLFYMWAKNKTHAVKIANERRTGLIATNQWYPV